MVMKHAESMVWLLHNGKFSSAGFVATRLVDQWGAPAAARLLQETAEGGGAPAMRTCRAGFQVQAALRHSLAAAQQQQDAPPPTPTSAGVGVAVPPPPHPLWRRTLRPPPPPLPPRLPAGTLHVTLRVRYDDEQEAGASLGAVADDSEVLS
jgi:hypothetical protein